MLYARNVTAFSLGFISLWFCFVLFFLSCHVSKYKLLVQVSGRDSNQMKAPVYILFCLTTSARMRSKVLILACQLNIQGRKSV